MFKFRVSSRPVRGNIRRCLAFVNLWPYYPLIADPSQLCNADSTSDHIHPSGSKTRFPCRVHFPFKRGALSPEAHSAFHIYNSASSLQGALKNTTFPRDRKEGWKKLVTRRIPPPRNRFSDLHKTDNLQPCQEAATSLSPKDLSPWAPKSVDHSRHLFLDPSLSCPYSSFLALTTPSPRRPVR